MKTALHIDQPTPTYEIHAAAVTGFAASAEKCAVRLRSTGDEDIVLFVDPEHAEAFKKAIDRAMQAHQAAKEVLGNSDAPEAPKSLSIRSPDTWQATTALGLDGVVLAFDQGTPHAEAYGIATQAAKDMGRALIQQAKRVEARPKIIMPGQPGFVPPPKH